MGIVNAISALANNRVESAQDSGGSTERTTMSKQLAQILTLTKEEKRALEIARCADPIGILRERDALTIRCSDLQAQLDEAVELLTILQPQIKNWLAGSGEYEQINAFLARHRKGVK